MTTKPYELLARFAEDGTVAGCHVRTIGTDPNGRKYESDPIPLKDATDPAFTKFAESFSASAVAENETLKAAKTKLESDLAVKTTEYDTTKAALEKLAADMTELVEAHKTELDAKEAALTEANATIAALEARVASLLTELPFNPRIIDASKFYERITKDEFAALSVSNDETLRTIAKTILAYKTNDWPVVFESPEFQQMMGYLMFGTSPPFLSDERARELARDATRAEAYDAA